MSDAAPVTLVMTQGEDFTAQIVWTTEQGLPQPVTTPMRLDVVGAGMQPIISLTTPDTVAPDGTIPEISYSSEIGLIQIHVPRSQTALLPAGAYQYDMFVTVDDGNAYAGNQQLPLMGGSFIINQRITKM